MNWTLIARWLSTMHTLRIGDEQGSTRPYGYIEWSLKHGGLGIQWSIDNFFGHRELLLILGPLLITAGYRTESEIDRLSAYIDDWRPAGDDPAATTFADHDEGI